jgi:hypothetical protein
MTDVPEAVQGTNARAQRGKELHDKVVSEKALGEKRKEAFIHGAKNNSTTFGAFPYMLDNYENKNEWRRVGRGLPRNS